MKRMEEIANCQNFTVKYSLSQYAVILCRTKSSFSFILELKNLTESLPIILKNN